MGGIWHRGHGGFIKAGHSGSPWCQEQIVGFNLKEGGGDLRGPQWPRVFWDV